MKKLEGIKNYKEYVEEDVIYERKSIRTNQSSSKRGSLCSIDNNINKNTEKLKLNFFLITNLIYNEKNKNSPKDNIKKVPSISIKLVVKFLYFNNILGI
jgi:hypothetical protein